MSRISDARGDDGAEPMAKVYLESEDGEKIERMEPDAMLYQKEINEGTCVRILADGRMEKLFSELLIDR